MNVADTPIYGIGLCAGALGLERGLEFAIPLATGVEYRTAVVVERETDLACSMAARIEDGSLPALAWNSELDGFDGRPYRGRVGIVAAGFPCQSHSVAGKRKGTADERWIWAEIDRIIGEVEPELVWLENVAGLLRDTGSDSGTGEPELEDAADDAIGGMGSVLRDLAERGYDAEWLCLRASDVEFAHQRKRVFILAYRSGSRRGGREDAGPDFIDAGADGCGSLEPSGDRVLLEHAEREGRPQPELTGVRGSATQDGSGLDDRLERASRLVEHSERAERRPGSERSGNSEPWSDRQGQEASGVGDGISTLGYATSGGLGECGESPGSAGQPDRPEPPLDDTEGIAGRLEQSRGSRSAEPSGRSDGLGDAIGPNIGAECAPIERAVDELADTRRGCDEQRGVGRLVAGSPGEIEGEREQRERGGNAAVGSFDIAPLSIPGPGLGAAGVIDDIRELYRKSPKRAWERYQAELRNTVLWSEMLVRYPWMRPAISQEEAESALRGSPDGLADLVAGERTFALRAIGNGVVSLQAAVAFIELLRRIAL